MATNSIFVYEIESEFEQIASELYRKLSRMPDDGMSHFKLQLVSEDELDGEFIIVKNVEEVYYDAQTRNVEKRTVAKANVIYFHVYNKNLEVWGQKLAVNQMIYMISNLLGDLCIQAVEIPLVEMIDILKRYNAKIGRVSFEDFLFDDSLIGNFSVDLSTYSNAFSIIEKYQEKISKMNVLISTCNNTVKLKVTAKGNLTVYKKRDDLDIEEVELLRNIIRKRG